MNRSTCSLTVGIVLVLLAGLLLGACGPDGTTSTRAPAPSTPAPAVPATPEPTPAPTANAAEADLDWYDHVSGRFGLAYPSGWSINEEANSVTFGNPADTLGIFVHFSDLGETLDAAGIDLYIDEFFSAEDGMAANPGFAIVQRADQEDGSVLVEYTFDSEAGHTYAASFFEQHDTILYILTFLAMDEAEWDSNLPMFNQIANSLAIYQQSWSTLTSEAGQYAIDYPPSWEAFEQGGDAYIGRDEETFMVIFVTTTLPAADPDEAERLMSEEVIEQLRNDDPGAQIDELDVLPMGGVMGHYADFRYIDPDTGLENSGTLIHVVHRGQGYRFLIFALTGDFAEVSDMFVEILLSFRFLD